ncbi:spore-associated protein [Streptomyces liangshanensis]|uniref:Spore-associated protein n=1 Tax=Streptomyces liangshanensis TaxID=2717324 RepID=A0A6G9GRZ4_9ACTN|nr:spore-associated protein [Streptomyces liangshanensis]QIQ01028.1 spore-associated protein [Streptomyces liangshanensis]
MRFGISRRAAAVGALAAALVGGTALTAPPAGAAVTQAKYNGVCGPAYRVVDSAPVGTLGTVFLTVDPARGTHCVVTVRSKPGARMYMAAYVNTSMDPDPIDDTGEFTTYAGPVYAGSTTDCVGWWGWIGATHGEGPVTTGCE